MSTKPRPEPARPIMAGKVTFTQTEPRYVTITHKGKGGDIMAVIDAARLEKWATRILREEAFA